MSRSFFNAFSGVAAHQRSLQQIADNLANVNTAGYKRSEVSFTELLYAQLREKRYSVHPLPDRLEPDVGKGTHMYPVTPIFDQGQLMLSDRPLDIAIEGKGYFRVINQNGDELYTRNGAFYVDVDGNLVTDQGDFLDTNASLADIVPNSVTITPVGQVWGVNEEGETVELGQINIFTFINQGGLEKTARNLFRETEASGDAIEGTPGDEGFGSLRQYYLEASNVDLGFEMVQLIQAQRALQGNVRSLITADELKALTLLVRG